MTAKFGDAPWQKAILDKYVERFREEAEHCIKMGIPAEALQEALDLVLVSSVMKS